MPQPRRLPDPPPGRTGWPWSISTVGPWDADQPLITVVVPSYQQGPFLEETLRSILAQDYPSLEVIVMDGGSRDETVSILERYAPLLAHWQSAKDGGQTAAINAGWTRAGGALLTWLNSDDTLLPGWAQRMSTALGQPNVDLACTEAQVVDQDGKPLWVFPAHVPDLETVLSTWSTPFPQPGFLMHRRVHQTFGPLQEDISFAMDTEYWLRLMVGGVKVAHVEGPLATFRMHLGAKTSNLQARAIEDLLRITTQLKVPPELQPLKDRAMRRRYYNAGRAALSAGMRRKAAEYALLHLQQAPRAHAVQAALVLGAAPLGARGNLALARLGTLARAVRRGMG